MMSPPHNHKVKNISHFHVNITEVDKILSSHPLKHLYSCFKCKKKKMSQMVEISIFQLWSCDLLNKMAATIDHQCKILKCP